MTGHDDDDDGNYLHWVYKVVQPVLIQGHPNRDLQTMDAI